MLKPTTAFTITILTALDNPIYAVSPPPGALEDARLCVLCPGKVMKNEKMVGAHMISGVSRLLLCFLAL